MSNAGKLRVFEKSGSPLVHHWCIGMIDFWEFHRCVQHLLKDSGKNAAQLRVPRWSGAVTSGPDFAEVGQ